MQGGYVRRNLHKAASFNCTSPMVTLYSQKANAFDYIQEPISRY